VEFELYKVIAVCTKLNRYVKMKIAERGMYQLSVNAIKQQKRKMYTELQAIPRSADW